MLESVVNLSEGRSADHLEQLQSACATHLLDIHVDADHHRSVFTMAGPNDDGAERGAHELSVAALDLLSLGTHDGVHPRLGTIDVVPFVPLFNDASGMAWAVGAARRYAVWLERMGIPSFLYGEADPLRRSLPDLRKNAFKRRFPDFGPKVPDARHGAVAVGARPPMVALNLNAESNDLRSAQEVAQTVRESSGGMAGVRALAFELASQNRVQVSMNIVDLDRAPLGEVILTVESAMQKNGLSIAEIELVGLIPGSALQAMPASLRERCGWGDAATVEGRLIQRFG